MLIGTPGMPRASVGFVGFHHLFHPIYNNITLSLAHRFELDVAEPDVNGHLRQIPKYLFFSVYDKPHLDHRYDRCVKIFTCEENIRTPWSECRYSMTGDYVPDPRHLRLPIYVRARLHVREQAGYADLKNPCPSLVKDPATNWEELLRSKTKFCNFVYSNGLAQERIRFFELLSRYKKVDSGGAVLNNLGYRVVKKLSFLEPYKFTIAFENSSYPGYVSEKVVEPMFSGGIPIYWGSSRISDDFNPRSMVIATGRRLEDVVDEVVALDRDDAAYLAKLREPWFHGNVPNRYCHPDYVADFLAMVFNDGKSCSSDVHVPIGTQERP